MEPSVRIYLAGRAGIEGPSGFVEQAAFPGRQGRVVFAYLVLQHRPVPREELASVVWPADQPAAWEAALSAVVSKLRRLLGSAGLPGQTIEAELGCYELHLPPGAWVDVEAAAAAVHQAEAALHAGDLRAAWGAGGVAYHITRRAFLPGDEGPWTEQQRAYLLSLHARATECLGTVSLRNTEPTLAVALAEELVRSEPFRETGHQLLMRAHAASGSRAQALLAYERCRRLLADELGVDPSPETQALHLELLTAE